MENSDKGITTGADVGRFYRFAKTCQILAIIIYSQYDFTVSFPDSKLVFLSSSFSRRTMALYRVQCIALIIYDSNNLNISHYVRT